MRLWKRTLTLTIIAMMGWGLTGCAENATPTPQPTYYIPPAALTRAAISAAATPTPVVPTATPFVRPTLVAAPNVHVRVLDNYFVPEAAMVKIGEVIEWYHTGYAMHTISADNSSWDSGAFQHGELFQMSFKEPGTYLYRCFLHTGMRGIIVVN